jgi:hypothetical protein
MFTKHQSTFFLASIIMFNAGGIMLPLFGLDWLSWSMMVSAAILWFIGMKCDPN